MNLNYAIWNQFQITFIYDEQTSIYQGASWTDARAEVRRLLATDFKRYGTISDAFGNCFIVNGSRIKSVTYSENTFQMLITFKDDSTLLARCVTDEIGTQNYRYIKFLKASNDLANVKRNRTIKVIAQNATQSDFIFPTFASLNENLNEGDYIIVNPGTYSMAESFTLKNGVDIEMKEDVIVNVNYTAGDSTRNAIFTDGIDTDALELIFGGANKYSEFVGSTDKRIFARIFGDASITINDAPAGWGTPLLMTYYDSELYAQFSSWESNNAAPSIGYGINGVITFRIEDITNAEQLLDNDYYCYAMDLDTLNATCIGSFYPGVDSNVTNPLAMIRNANIVSNAGTGIDSISQASMVYHYINVYDTGNVTWDYDLFAQTGSQFYMHNAKIESEIFTSGTHDSTWYNNGFNNYINNSTGSGGWTFIEDSLTLE